DRCRKRRGERRHMSSAALIAPEGLTQDRALTAEVLVHLDKQIDSARSLLEVVLEQGAAIRARDVHTVVRLAGILAGEMGRRRLLEEERARLLARSGERLGIAAEAVTLERLRTLMDHAGAELASVRSAELRGLLRELQREHSCNRALMQIELGFLDHLMGILALDGVNGYDTHGSSTPITRSRPHGALHVLDLRA
ncbi:MAG: flagellar export chaperone FlgN, partial [Solirubrobacteraceae bacterium]